MNRAGQCRYRDALVHGVASAGLRCSRSYERATAATTEHTTSSGQPREGIVNKMKRGMGAAGSDTVDSARRARMDQAYDNWKSRQK